MKDENQIEYDKLEKHLNMKIPMTIESFRSMFDEIPNKVRLEMIKSIIWSSNNMEEMWNMVNKEIASDKFRQTLD